MLIPIIKTFLNQKSKFLPGEKDFPAPREGCRKGQEKSVFQPPVWRNTSGKPWQALKWWTFLSA
jgi:hypothetical protein